jgi:hypothetical protein
MPLTLNRLLRRGYLPKELPPPFGSESYGAALRTAPTEFADGKLSLLCPHNLARPGMLRRVLGIPNPVAFHSFASVMLGGWAQVQAVISASPYTITAPQSHSSDRRALVPAGKADRGDARARHSASSRYVVFADVSQWYPSVYSHSIAWALHGKAYSKQHKKAKNLGNSLDKKLTALQDGQSVGIPIGPDISLALGELVLSACDADVATALAGTSVNGFRYFDDYELFAGSRSDADRAVTELQKALATYQLTLNPHKFDVVELPLPVEEDWVSAVKRIDDVRSSPPSSEKSDLLLLFDEAFRQAKKNPSHPVLKYAIGRFVTSAFEWRQRVSETNWLLFQRLLLQTALAEPGTLEKVTALLSWEKSRGRSLDEPNVTNALNLLVGEAAQSGHSSEVAWGLFAAAKLGVKMTPAVTRLVSDMADDVVAITALDAQDRGVFPTPLDTSLWRTWMTKSELYGEHWLAAYEAYEHGWLVTTPDYIAGDTAFAHLRANDVRFYNERRRFLPKAKSGVLAPGRPARAGGAAPGRRPTVIQYLAAAEEPEPDEEPEDIVIDLGEIEAIGPYG